MSPVPVAVRLNVGNERASVVHKTFPPQTDFECWGWMSKKGGVRRNWLERFFHLSPAGILTYYENCNTVGVKKGGSTKMRLVGFKEKGSLDLKSCLEVRMGTAGNKTPGELELVMEERVYREFACKPLFRSCVWNLCVCCRYPSAACRRAGMRVGRIAGGTKQIEDQPAAAHVWVACLNLALIATTEKEAAEQGRTLGAAVEHVQRSLQSDPS